MLKCAQVCSSVLIAHSSSPVAHRSLLECARRSSPIARRSTLALDALNVVAKESGRREEGGVGKRRRRPRKETLEELERLCRHDRRVVSTPIPRPASGSLTKFFVVQRPPLPAPLPSRHLADVGPTSCDAERRVLAAARAARIDEYTEAVIEDIAAESTSRPASPVREDDHYGLAKFRRWSVRW